MSVTYTQQLLDRVAAYAGQPLTDRRSAAGLAELASLYAAITGQQVGACRQCQYSDYLAALTNYSRSATRFLHPELMPDSKYALAAGLENEQIVHDSYGKVVTSENLEDKDVEFFQSKGMGKLFVLKSKKGAAEAAPIDGSATTDEAAETSEAEQKLKDEVAAGKTALKTEKDAHAATKKEHGNDKKEIARLTKALAEAQDALQKATAVPAGAAADQTPPVDPGATA